jgi:hypothetical protein
MVEDRSHHPGDSKTSILSQLKELARKSKLSTPHSQTVSDIDPNHSETFILADPNHSETLIVDQPTQLAKAARSGSQLAKDHHAYDPNAVETMIIDQPTSLDVPSTPLTMDPEVAPLEASEVKPVSESTHAPRRSRLVEGDRPLRQSESQAQDIRPARSRNYSPIPPSSASATPSFEATDTTIFAHPQCPIPRAGSTNEFFTLDRKQPRPADEPPTQIFTVASDKAPQKRGLRQRIGSWLARLLT